VATTDASLQKHVIAALKIVLRVHHADVLVDSQMASAKKVKLVSAAADQWGTVALLIRAMEMVFAMPGRAAQHVLLVTANATFN
jgi:hypothetical protein